MFDKKNHLTLLKKLNSNHILLKLLLVFVIICSCFTPVLATDSVYVWSDMSAPEAITTSSLLRR